MRTATFYRCSLLLPMAVPAGLAPLLAAPLRDGLRDAIGMLVIVSIYAAIPYVIVALGLLRWMTGMIEREMRSAALVAPWAMTGTMVLLAGILGLFSGGSDSWAMFAGALCILAVLSLAFGYAYVGLAHGLLALLRACGCVERAEAA
jgi:hypothetical protein